MAKSIDSVIEDLQRRVGWLEARDTKWAAANNKLNASEAMLRAEVGDDAAVDAMVATFKQMAETDMSLGAAMQADPNPYRFAYEHVTGRPGARSSIN